MDDHEVWPLPYTGLPALLNSLSIIMFAMLVVVSMTLRYNLLFILLFMVAISLSLASLGRRVVVDDGVIILEYGYPKPLLKYRITGIVEVFDINELSRGKLVKYFKSLLTPFIIIMVLPVIYVIVRGIYPSPTYITLMTVPIAMGVSLLLYFMFTAPSYRKFLRCAFTVTAIIYISLLALIIGYYYGNIYGRIDLLVALIGTSLIILCIALPFLARQNHIIIIVDENGSHYAVGTHGEEVAKAFIKTIIKTIQENIGDTWE